MTRLILLFSALVLFAEIPEFSYEHPELKLFSFTSPKLVNRVDIEVNYEEGSSDVLSENWYETYRFTGDTAMVEIGGKGNIRYCAFDDQGRIESIKEGPGIIYFGYSESCDTITVFLTDTALTKYSHKYCNYHNRDATITKIVRIGTDWEEGVPNSEFWDPAHADTALITYDTIGRISGVKRIFWDTNLFHTLPWQLRVDSLAYTYTSGQDSSLMISQYQQHPVSKEWELRKESWAIETNYNPAGQPVTVTELRWDASAEKWDDIYRRVTRNSYDGGYLATMEQWLYWGKTGKLDSLMERREVWHYGDNPFLTNAVLSFPRAKSVIPKLNSIEKNLHCTLPHGGRWSIAVHSLQGRVLTHYSQELSEAGAVQINLKSFSSGVYLITVQSETSGMTYTQKVSL